MIKKVHLCIKVILLVFILINLISSYKVSAVEERYFFNIVPTNLEEQSQLSEISQPVPKNILDNYGTKLIV